MPDLPRLIAFDADDLAVIAANLQDALVRVGEMAFLPQSKQFAMVAARFDWVQAAAKKRGRRSRLLDEQRSVKSLSIIAISFFVRG